MSKPVEIKIIKIQKLMIAARKNAGKLKTAAPGLFIMWEANQQIIQNLINTAKAAGKDTIIAPQYAIDLITKIAKNKTGDFDNIGAFTKFHDDTEKPLRRYTKLTKWHKNKNLNEFQKGEFALYLAYMFEKELYNNDFDKERRKYLAKMYKKKYFDQEVFDQVVDWAIEKGYCSDRLSSLIGGYLKAIGPDPNALKGLFKKKKKAA